MKAAKNIAVYHRLRGEPLWKLLNADNAPMIVGILQTHLFEGERSVSASVFCERIGRDLEHLRTQGFNFPQPAQSYAADWLAAGYLERRFPVGASEEVYELSAASAAAIRILASISAPRVSATESRLSVVIQQLSKLADDTESDPKARIATLTAERDRIDEQIRAIEMGRVQALPNSRALERIREIISLADDLAGDFHRVRDQFEQLNRGLREKIMGNDGSRGEVLEALFAGVDVIADSEAGRTFAVFWQLLTDPEQSSTFEQALDKVLSRDFATAMQLEERRFLLRLIRTLLDQGGAVHEVLQTFARSLKHFVQSREFLEQRRLNELLREAQRNALKLKEQVNAAQPIDFNLRLTTCRLQSLDQWVLFDPETQTLCPGMAEGESASIDLQEISGLVKEAEIDFRTLKANICRVLQDRSQASVAEVLNLYPAAQGLGSVVGYIALGCKHGQKSERTEPVTWRDRTNRSRSAQIPVIYFLQERVHELK